MILFFFAQLKLFQGYITYDTNLFQDFDYGIVTNFMCKSNTNTATINFSGTFANIPQIILTFDKYDIEVSPSFQFSITSVTVGSFSIKLSCLTQRVYRYQLRWYAIDDPRIEIINCFNQIPTLTKTISHSNPNALYGFVSITSFYMTGSTNFILSIQSITATSVTVNLSSITNLDQIGYQIILGVDNSFSSYTTKSFTYSYTSPSINIEKNKFFLLPLCGFNYPNSYNIRLEKTFTKSGDALIYQVSKSAGSFAPHTNLQIQIPFEYITISKAFKVSHLQISALEDYTQTLGSNFQIKIYELNQIYQNIGTYSLEINDSTSILNIDVYVKCSQNNKIQAKLNNCGSCSKQGLYELKRSCYATINRYNFKSRFQISIMAKKFFTITISQQSVQVTQLVYTENQNSVQTQLNIIYMELKDN